MNAMESWSAQMLFITLLLLITGVTADREERLIMPGPFHLKNFNFTLTECKDQIDDCKSYKYSVCEQYQPWALQRCAAYCEFCIVDNPVTTPAPLCNDTLPNCNEYNNDTCTNPFYYDWARKNCRKFCNLCHETDRPHFHWTVATTTKGPTTTTDPLCHDTISNCAYYGENACVNYSDWARVRCAAYCHFCGTSPPPTTEPPCVDKLTNCEEFQNDTCTNDQYESWAAENCRAFCNICNVTTEESTTVTTEESTTATTEGTTIHTTTITTTETTRRSTQAPYYGQGATGPSGEFYCAYKGKTYKEGETWQDGCLSKCTCKEAKINNISCSDFCPSWNVPSFCQLIRQGGQCCPTVHCNVQS